MQTNNTSILTIIGVCGIAYTAFHLGEIKGYIKGVVVTNDAWEKKIEKEKNE